MIEINYDDLAAELRVLFGENRTQKAVKHVVQTALQTALYDADTATIQADDDIELARLCNLLVLSHPSVQNKYANGLPVAYYIWYNVYDSVLITTIDPHGVEDYFSWAKAAENASRIMKSSTLHDREKKLRVVRQRNHDANVISAMRLAIQNQVDEFRKNYAIRHGGMYISKITGNSLRAENVYVDHHPLDFADIVNDWLTQHKIGLSDVAIENNIGSFRGYRMSDSQQKESWSKYHRDVARLRIISTQENWRKGRAKVIRHTV